MEVTLLLLAAIVGVSCAVRVEFEVPVATRSGCNRLCRLASSQSRCRRRFLSKDQKCRLSYDADYGTFETRNAAIRYLSGQVKCQEKCDEDLGDGWKCTRAYGYNGYSGLAGTLIGSTTKDGFDNGCIIRLVKFSAPRTAPFSFKGGYLTQGCSSDTMCTKLQKGADSSCKVHKIGYLCAVTYNHNYGTFTLEVRSSTDAKQQCKANCDSLNDKLNPSYCYFQRSRPVYDGQMWNTINQCDIRVITYKPKTETEIFKGAGTTRCRFLYICNRLHKNRPGCSVSKSGSDCTITYNANRGKFSNSTEIHPKLKQKRVKKTRILNCRQSCTRFGNFGRKGKMCFKSANVGTNDCKFHVLEYNSYKNFAIWIGQGERASLTNPCLSELICDGLLMAKHGCKVSIVGVSVCAILYYEKLGKITHGTSLETLPDRKVHVGAACGRWCSNYYKNTAGEKICFSQWNNFQRDGEGKLVEGQTFKCSLTYISFSPNIKSG